MPSRVHPYSTFALVVCRHPGTGKWLAVQEAPRHQCLWWLPAGSVDPGETFPQAAHREAREEAGIAIRLLGVLRVEHECISPAVGYRMRVVFYAEPLDAAVPLKAEADEESTCAQWLGVEELRALQREGQLRGQELLLWAAHLERGGANFPLSVLGPETEGPPAAPPPEAGAAAAGGAGSGGSGSSSASAAAASTGDLLLPPWTSATLQTFQQTV
jgi:8-oxo-dGTP pyrophosphatase MutT (NUDIX family)